MQRRHSHHGFQRLVQGLALGAISMYLLDPDKGRRRRALAQDKLQRLGNDVVHLVNQMTRDAGNRLHGMNARLQRRAHGDESPDALRLIERVRSAMGRAVSHPHAVQVGVRGGTVVLSGPVLAGEVRDLVECIHQVPGVTAIENHLDAHEPDARIPSLQGEGRRRGAGGGSWTPASRLAALLGGGALAVYGLARRSGAGLLVALGAAALARSAAGQHGEDARQGAWGGGWATDPTRSEIPRIGDDGTPSRKVDRMQGRDTGTAGRREAMTRSGDVPLLGDDGTPAWRGNGHGS